MKLHILSVPLLLLVLIAGCVAGGSNMASYNPESVATIRGAIEQVSTVLNTQTKEDGLHLEVMTEKGPYEVHVCPQWYADKNDIRFAKGESVTIVGATFVKDGKDNIYAASITDSNGQLLNLRDQQSGDSLWAGRSRDESLPQQDQAKQEKTEQEMKEKNRKSDSPAQEKGDGSKIGSQRGKMW